MEGTSVHTLTDVADIDSSNEAVMEYILGAHLAVAWHREDCSDSYTWYLAKSCAKLIMLDISASLEFAASLISK